MKRFRRIGLSLVIAVAMLVAFALPVAANTTVTITIAAEIVAITNTMDAWAIGAVPAGTVAKYFSANNLEDIDYSLITNTGNVAVNVAIQGTNFEGGAYDWTLAAAAGGQTYSLHAYNVTAAAYSIEVKSSAYNNICAALPATGSDTYAWSMKMMTPTTFDPADLGNNKTATVTLVASKS